MPHHMQNTIQDHSAAALPPTMPSSGMLISDSELRELFDLVDLDHSGEIDIDELCALFGKFGPTPSASEVLDMMNAKSESGQAALGLGMTISFEQFKSIILSGSKDSNTFSRWELETAFVALQSNKDARGKIDQTRMQELMRSFGPKTDRDTTRKHHQILREYSSDGRFDFLKLLQALEDEGVLTKDSKPKTKSHKKPKTPKTPKTPATTGAAANFTSAALDESDSAVFPEPPTSDLTQLQPSP